MFSCHILTDFFEERVNVCGGGVCGGVRFFFFSLMDKISAIYTSETGDKKTKTQDLPDAVSVCYAWFRLEITRFSPILARSV